MDPTKQTLLVGGLVVDVYSHPSSTDPTIPVHALVFLHGRFGSSQHADVVTTAKAIFDVNYGSGAGSPRTKDLIIVAFGTDLRIDVDGHGVGHGQDHRNHGTRLVNIERNFSWNPDPAKNNDQHAVDMYTIQTGSAQDVSFLIDHLPSFLYPSSQRTIVEWGMGGVSLGGHATWIALSREPRLKIGIPIIGCPDYTKLISQRALSSGVPFKPPYYPDSLKEYVGAHDPAQLPYRATDASNPFLGRKILVLSGANDTLVPWVATKEFVQGLEVGKEGIKRFVLQEGAGHECTPAMQREAGSFVREWLSDWSNANL
ncbi:Alpha/Beta hydrolase protein [Suillus clintonianus]|uniref:Alpha/Beta hydrolase protein n=1 Tax=Suillus clintonianus TaxID=1904413 RepID=UPI001B8670A1|nr:Alpha/Beta hydrolase protein [Suillus clintonianus]KAG2139331.1 Alpha/Beta hydrolase protein [Suillus clintonianus]